MNEITIVIKDGSVQRIISTTEQIEINVVDYDSSSVEYDYRPDSIMTKEGMVEYLEREELYLNEQEEDF